MFRSPAVFPLLVFLLDLGGLGPKLVNAKPGGRPALMRAVQAATKSGSQDVDTANAVQTLAISAGGSQDVLKDASVSMQADGLDVALVTGKHARLQASASSQVIHSPMQAVAIEAHAQEMMRKNGNSHRPEKTSPPSSHNSLLELVGRLGSMRQTTTAAAGGLGMAAGGAIIGAVLFFKMKEAQEIEDDEGEADGPLDGGPKGIPKRPTYSSPRGASPRGARMAMSPKRRLNADSPAPAESRAVVEDESLPPTPRGSAARLAASQQQQKQSTPVSRPPVDLPSAQLKASAPAAPDSLPAADSRSAQLVCIFS
jgi:hypothetical protein